MLRTEIDSMPQELDEMSRKIMQREIEIQALKSDKSDEARERLQILEQQLSDQKHDFHELKAKWEVEKSEIVREKELKTQIEEVKRQIEEAEREYNLEKLAELKYGRLENLKKELEDYRSHHKAGSSQNTLLKEEVTEMEISQIVSKWTGIPISKLVETEKDKLLHLDRILHQRVIGQDEAVQVVTDAIIRARSGLKDPTKPIGSFMFLGPTGVGKTELAKALSEAMFDDEDNIVRIDMSEYMEKHAVSRLIGAPPGYVGYEEGGQLTEAVRRRPYSVILFDEIEKAHPDVFNVLLQLLDDGRLTDNQGHVVDFKNTIIVMTSNIGSQYLLEYAEEYVHQDTVLNSEHLSEEVKKNVMQLMHRTFKPELINRLDETVLFTPLSIKAIEGIVELSLNQVRRRLEDRKVKLEVTDRALEQMAKDSYNPAFGARPVKRFIQSKIETMLGRAIIANDIRENETAVIDFGDDGYYLAQAGE